MANEQAELLKPEEIREAKERIDRVVDALSKIILGREEVIHLVVVGMLARGHILLEGLPGLGKTELVKGISRLLGLKFNRVQFTPDLLPGDITGNNILQETPEGRRLVFHPGPIFANLVLADEINRASPKTQSALLEAMQERRVTVFGHSYELPYPFFVLATQNPIELEGTYPLPEAQVDRFMLKLYLDATQEDVLERIIGTRHRGEPPQLGQVLDEEGLRRVFALVDRVHLPAAVGAYISRLVAATHREHALAPDAAKQFVKYGASPRAAIAIAETARAEALLRGKPNVGFEEVGRVAAPAMAHRLVLDYTAKLEGVDGRRVVADLLASVPELAKDIPDGLRHAEATRP